MRPDLDPEVLMTLNAELDRLASRLVGGVDADDVRQDAWLAAVDARAGGAGSAPLAGWLGRATRFRAWRRRRGEERRRRVEARAARDDKTAETPFDVLERHEVRMPLAAGRYRLRLRGEGVAHRTVDAEVAPGETAAAHLVLESGRTIAFDIETAAEPPVRVTFELRDAKGHVIHRGARRPRGDGRVRLTLNIAFAPHRLGVTDETGRTGTAMIAPDAGEALRVVLR